MPPGTVAGEDACEYEPDPDYERDCSEDDKRKHIRCEVDAKHCLSIAAADGYGSMRIETAAGMAQRAPSEA